MIAHEVASWQVKEAKTIAELEKIKLANEAVFTAFPYLLRLYRYRFEELTTNLYSPEGAE